jgi:hypothetical protein
LEFCEFQRIFGELFAPLVIVSTIKLQEIIFSFFLVNPLLLGSENVFPSVGMLVAYFELVKLHAYYLEQN